MKKKNFRVLKLLFICFCCGAIFTAGGYFYLKSNMKEETENNVSQVPYSSPSPQNSGILLDISGSRTFFYLDFEKEKLTVIIPQESYIVTDNLFGYPINYRIEADYRFISDIIDLVDGIELPSNDGLFRYTGVQITSMLETVADTSELKREIISAVIEKISQRGFERENFLYIIENTETNLTVPDCYYWSDYIALLCKNGEIIN